MPTSNRYAFLALAALGAVLYFPILTLLPLRGDNLRVLAWVDQAPFTALAAVDPRIYPEWRPLAYLTIWLEHAVIQLQQVGVHHLVNLLLWVTCSWLVYRLVNEAGGSRPGAFVAAVWLLIDERSVDALTWIVERQSTLASVFGLIACWIVVRTSQRPRSRRETLAIAALLVASALSKEYGLAFGAALTCYAAAHRQRDLVWAGAGALLLYAGLRVTLAGNAAGGYCEEMGYFFVVREQCVVPLSPEGTGQMAYNLVANGIGLVLQGVLDGEGKISPVPTVLCLGMLALAAAMRAVRSASVAVQLLVLVVVFNAVLGAIVYRGRNQLVGMCAMAIIAGVGIPTWQQVATASRHRLLRAAVIAAIVALGAGRAFATHDKVAADVEEMLAQDPCESPLRQDRQGDEFARRVKATYGMADPNCVGMPSGY